MLRLSLGVPCSLVISFRSSPPSLWRLWAYSSWITYPEVLLWYALQVPPLHDVVILTYLFSRYLV
jgi:hypothetical protein